VNYNIFYTYKFVTDFVNVGIKLLNIETKETNNGRMGYITKRSVIFYCKVACPSLKFQTDPTITCHNLTKC